ncbi:flagellar hook-associated protein 2 [Thermanaeromonas toyohensis ToBE]|uniref:Flagellar hook-associated protein 2 n=1 Tax=Thermanaeromonas toyohensis ToBE TaxID=698762 RepID=A0A1W1VKJ2_9FIRM|nr:flagellar filament capping protein FliD [Thermanaeromonas toyohensis]SMB93905.1 flagellar hook-associated protein 2 [Thermanaeromonas toyohensis ToBE]
MADMRIVGIFSGLDTQSIIDKLMSLERKPIEILKSKEALLEKQREAWEKIGQELSSLRAALFDLTLSSTFAVKVATSSNTSVVEAQAATSASVGKFDITVTQLAQAQSVASSAYTDPTTALNLSGTFSINGKSITVTTSDSLNSIRDKINAAGAGVTATVVLQQTGSYRLVITSQTTGTAGAINFADDPTTKVLQSLGILDSTGAIANQLVAAQDAIFTVNGLNLTRGSNTVSDAIPGLTLYLKGAGSATLEVKLDGQYIIGKIKAFVDKYNTLMQDISSNIQYDANTRTAGTLIGDSSLSQLEASLRRWVSGLVEGASSPYNSLSGIGVSTSGEAPTLVIDEAKLSQALAAAPDQVASLFNKDSGSSSPSSADGVAVRLRKILDLWLTGSQSGVGFLKAKEDFFSQGIRSIEDQIQAMEERLKVRERVLWQQFNAMEEWLARLNAQSTWLAQQFSKAANNK